MADVGREVEKKGWKRRKEKKKRRDTHKIRRKEGTPIK